MILKSDRLGRSSSAWPGAIKEDFLQEVLLKLRPREWVRLLSREGRRNKGGLGKGNQFHCMKSGENFAAFSTPEFSVRESEKTRKQEAVTAESFSVLRESPAKLGLQELRGQEIPMAGAVKEGFLEEKGQAEEERQPRHWRVAGREPKPSKWWVSHGPGKGGLGCR